MAARDISVVFVIFSSCFLTCVSVATQVDTDTLIVELCNSSTWNSQNCSEVTRLKSNIFFGDDGVSIVDEFPYLKISNQELQMLPRYSLGNMSIVSLEVSSCGITTIEDGAFENLHVTDLSLNNNCLTVIRTNTFRKIYGIKELNLNNNEIHFLEDRVFEGMELEILDLSNNRIVELGAGDFRNSSIEYLSLNSNCMYFVPKGIFQHLKGLVTLDLSNNNISSIQEGSFDSLLGLRFLYLNNNSLDYVPKDTFNNRTMVKLNFDGNIIRNISSLAFDGSKIKYLSFSGNEIEVINTGTFQAYTIYYLVLSMNKICQIEPYALDSVRGGVELEFNKLEIIRRSTFNNAIIIVLTNNTQLKTIEVGSFNGRIERSNFFVGSTLPTIYVVLKDLDDKSQKYLHELDKSGRYIIRYSYSNAIRFPFM